MRIVDDIVLDPAEFAPDREELNLSEEGLTVLEADFGEADIELYMVKAALGEMPVDRHLPDTTVTLTLRVDRDDEVDLPTVAYRLQQKVGLIQREGGWVRRDFHYAARGEFAGSLVRQVRKATLVGLSAWARGDSPDVTLTLLTGPLWYATVEDESSEVKEESDRELIYTLEDVKGTAPGMRRVIVENLNSSGDWRGLIWAEESRDYSSAETALLAYEAEELTPKGGASEAERTGDSGKVIRHTNLTAGFLPILSSEIDGVGHMTHRGTRRVWLRVYDPGTSTDYCEVRMRWRALGSARWLENRIVPVKVTDGFSLLDMGDARPQAPAVGDDRWEFEIEVCAPDGSGALDIDKVYVLPTEQYLVLREPENPPAADAQSTKSPGTVANDTSAGTEEWSNASNAKASDNSRATVEVGNHERSQYLKATNFGFALPEAAIVVGVVASVERSADDPFSVCDAELCLVREGVLLPDTDKADSAPWPTTEATKSYGGSADLWDTTLTRAQVNASTFGVALRVRGMASGAEARVDQITLTVYYTTDIREDVVCFAERSIELRSDGCHRQHPEDDVWGRVIPIGFLPYAAPSGLEGRTSRGILIPTQGELDELADSGTNKIAAVVKDRAAYHFAREAT